MDAATTPNAPKPAAPADQRFFPVPIDSIDFKTLQMDLYLRFEGAAAALYRAAGVDFTPDDLARLIERGVKFLFIPAAQHAAYRRSMTERLDRTFADPALASIERGRIIRESCSKIIEDVLLFAGQGEPVEAVTEVSKTFVSWSNKDPNGFSYLLDMSSHDFGTATHMVNVGVGCGLLARQLFPDDNDLFQTVVQGGMLHDIGKRGIPLPILNKEGKLDPDEWKVVSAHPMKGYEELKKAPGVSDHVLSMVRDHHEHMSGAGYPQGLKEAQLSLPARICAVVDVFDAITAARPYRGATPPLETLKIMSKGRGSQFDPKLYDAFTAVVGRMLEADPSRAPVEAPNTKLRDLTELLPSAAAVAAIAPAVGATADAHSAMWKKNRRIHDRFNCSLAGTGVFHHQGKPLRVQVGETFQLQVVDVSRGGVQVLTPWPMTIGDTLTIELAPKAGVHLKRLARVVRVRAHGDHNWSAGLSFVETDEKKAAA